MIQAKKHPFIFVVMLVLLLVYPAIVGTSNSQARFASLIEHKIFVNKTEVLKDSINTTLQTILKQEDTIKTQQHIIYVQGKH